jgi:Zn-dependent peptidase ImmA (M78 family)
LQLLLIPEDRLNEKLNEGWVEESPGSISELAEEFQVLENFIKKRLEFKKANKI